MTGSRRASRAAYARRVPRTVDHESRRQEVGAIAAALIADGGLDAATIRDVASAAGYSTKAVTRYFADKRDLLLHVYRAAAARARTRLDAAVAMTPDDPLACVDELLPLDAPRRRDWAVWFAFWSVAIGDPAFQEEQRARVRFTHETLVRVVRSAVAAGRLPDDLDAERVAARLLTTVHGVAVQSVFDPRRWTVARQREALQEQLHALSTVR
jgi:AcrR family transcriptional regulator